MSHLSPAAVSKPTSSATGTTAEAPPVPMLDLKPGIAALRPQYDAALQRVMDSGQFIGGPEITAFEQEAAAYLGVRHAVGLNSGTDALVIGLRSLGIGCEDEVITTPFSFIATAEAASLINATPIFADIDPATFNLCPRQIEAEITEQTKAIVPVHLFGHAADMDPILDIAHKHGLAVLEDVAQAMGGRYRGRMLGSLGHAAAFSFFPTKTLGGFGDGGLLVSDDDAVADFARKLRNHGSVQRYHNELVGYNSRLDAFQAALLRVKLPHLDAANDARRRIAHRYTQAFSTIPGVSPPTAADYAHHVYHQYTIRLTDADRDSVQLHMHAAGVAANVYYPVSLPGLPVFSRPDLPLPATETASQQVLSLPIWPEMDPATQQRVIDTVREAVTAAHANRPA